MRSAASMLLLLLVATSVAKAALPEPPNQHNPWTPPVSQGIPDYVVRVTAWLFDAGLADPRGCTYREVEVLGLAENPDNTNDRQTHAWVFSGKYAVAWNG